MECLVVLLLLSLYGSCKGQDETTSSVGALIGGGSPAPKGRFPYMCSIRKGASEAHVCGGILINEKWLMTAAQCLDPDNPSSAGKSPSVYCNIYRREEQNVANRLTTTRCYLHHLWDGNVLNGDDIALCQLEKAIAVDIPQLSSIGDGFSKSDAFSALGWGLTSSEGDLADVLQIEFPLLYLASSACNIMGHWAGRIKDSMICAGRGTLNTCKGDSGGPLFLRHDPENRDKDEDPQFDLIVGVTSFGDDDCEAYLPSVYTRISCYRPWIDCMMQGMGQDCSIHIPCGVISPKCSGVANSTTFNETYALEEIIIAVESDNSETVKEILCEGLSPNAVYGGSNQSSLHRAAAYNAIESAKVLLRHGSHVNYKSFGGATPLLIAAFVDSDDVAKLLIENGANIESKTVVGSNPLHIASLSNSLGVAKLLIRHGANIESETDIGFTPLHFAARNNALKVLRLLIENGANVKSKDNYAFTPLHYAPERNSIDAAKFLIENGADIESKNVFGSTPLHEAAKHNSIDVAKILLENGAQIEIKNTFGNNPLHEAAEYNSNDVAKILLDNGADIEARTNGGLTPLHIVAQHNSSGVARELIANGVNIQSENNLGSSPLHIAAYHGSLSVLYLLLDEKAIVDSTNNDGSTPLHAAASRGHISVVRSLLRNGASKTSTDNNENTPFDVICTTETSDELCKDDDITTLEDLLKA